MQLGAGDFNCPIVICRKTLTPDAAGGLDTPGETVLANRFAKVESLTGTEEQTKFAQHGEQIYKLTCQYDPTLATVNTTDYVRYAGQKLEIVAAVDPNGRRRYFEITAIARTQP
jgi:head-tail adaptor